MKAQFFSVIIVALILFSNQGISQSDSTFVAQDTTLASQYFAQAAELRGKAQYDSSLYYFEKASVIFEKIATQYDDTKTWERYIECLGKVNSILQIQGKYDMAMEFLKRALEIGLNKLGENHVQIAKIYLEVGVVYSYKLDFEKAFEYYNKAFKMITELIGENHPMIATVYNRIGAIYYQKGDYNKALEYINKSLAIIIELEGENVTLVSDLYYNIALFYEQKGYLDKAMDYCNKSLAIRLRLLKDSDPKISDCYDRIGTIYYFQGDFSNALEYYNKSFAIDLQVFGINHQRIAYRYNNIGMIYFENGDYNNALDYYNKSLTIKLQLLGANHPDIANTYNNIGIIYLEKKYYDKALEYFTKSLSIRIQTLGDNHSLVARSYKNIGYAFYQNGSFNKANEYFCKALKINIDSFGEKNSEVAEIYYRLGNIYFKQNSYEKSLSYSQKAMISLVSDFNDTNIYSNPPFRNIFLDKTLLSTFELKADVFQKLYSLKSHEIKDIKISLATYQLASDLIDKIRSSYKGKDSKLFLGEKVTEIYNKAIQTALKLHQVTQDSEYKEQAFLFAEKAKSSVLLESLQDTKARQFGNIPDSLLDKEREFRIDLAYYDTQIQKELGKKEKMDSLKIREFQDQHFALSTQYQKLIKKIEADFPRYYNIKYQTHTATIPELQRYLDDKSALLNYFIGDSLIHIFVVSKDGFNITSLEKDSLFDNTIESLSKSIKKLDASGFVEKSYQTYNLLIKPVEQFISDKEKLVIIPHSILYKIPFEALLSQKPGKEAQTDFTKLDYLINRFDISYHYSATLYLNSLSKADKLLAENWQKDNLFIGFAPIFSDEAKNGYILASNLPTFDLAYAESDVRSISLDGKRFNELQYSEKEVENIIKMYEKKRSEAIGFFHTNATEDNFKSNVGNYKYVHIATHGIINEEKPQLSGIIFSQPADSVYKEDGILYSNETYNLDLNADLVVLSSCESGIGKLVRGEGLMALTRGFLYSGASNIIVSLWKVSDKHTSQLMVDFYKNILAEKSYARSLREAKLRMIENAATAFPKSWSSFVLLGK